MSNKREMKNLKNLNFLRKMFELKSELFGAYSATVTKETKKNAWTAVRDYAVSIGLITSDKDYTYVRDTTWTNLRKRTMEKIDKSSKTGASGSPDSKLDAIDDMVLTIIGKESPALKGIGVEDSMSSAPFRGLAEKVENFEVGTLLNEEISEANVQICAWSPMDDSLIEDTAMPATTNGRKRKQVIVRTCDTKKQLEILKKQKLELEVLKTKLEVWELENRLKVEHSELTKSIKSLFDV